LLLWASAFVEIRSAGAVIAPGAMVFVRLLVGAIVLGLVALRYRRPLPRGRALGLVVAYGVLWFAGYGFTLNWAEQHLDAGTAALLVNIAPILVAAVAGVVFGDGFPRPLIVGMLIAFGGVVLIAAGSDSRAGADSLGVVLALLAAALYAAAVLLQKVALRSVDAVTATWVACLAGLAATVPFIGQAVGALRGAPASAVLGVVYLGVGPSAIAFTTWAYALSRSDAGRLAATTLCLPALAILLSWAVLGEVPTALGLAGGALCLAGVAISRRPGRALPATAPPAVGKAAPPQQDACSASATP
jgi:drug/metabolite transporter (DMT)-like permease